MIPSNLRIKFYITTFFIFLLIISQLIQAQTTKPETKLSINTTRSHFEVAGTDSIIKSDFKKIKYVVSSDALLVEFKNIIASRLKEKDVLDCKLMFANKTITPFYYSKGATRIKTNLMTFATKGVEDAFWTLEEVAAFWKDTLVVIDTLPLNFSKLGGIANAQVNYKLMEKQFPLVEKGNHTYELSSRLPGLKQGSYQQIELACASIDGFKFNATIYFLTNDEKSELVSFVRDMIQDDTEINMNTLASYAFTYIRSDFGPPVEQNIIRFISKTGFAK